MSKLEKLFNEIIPEDYVGTQPPKNMMVNTAVLFLSVASVKFSRMEIEVEFFFLAGWRDDRLNHNQELSQIISERNPSGLLPIPEAARIKLWVPMVVFSECKRCKTGMALGVDRVTPLVYNSKTGEILTYYRDTMEFGCKYDLTYYPFDAHECSILFQLVGGALENKPVGKLVDFYDTHFTYPREHTIRNGLPSEFGFDSLRFKHGCSEMMFGPPPASHDHCLKYSIRFHRIIASYLMLVYLPSFTVVVVSWISFWISPDIPAPRITLGLTSLLTLSTQFTNSQKDLPPVAYIKALDVWMMMCSVMVFSSLMEFALSYVGKSKTKTVEPTTQVKESKALVFTATFSAKDGKHPPQAKKTLEDLRRQKPNFLDRISRILFPVIFLIFNIVYWPYYGRGSGIYYGSDDSDD